MGRWSQSLCCGCTLLDRTLLKHVAGLVFITFFVVLPIASLQLRFSLYYPLWPRDIKTGQSKMRLVNNERLKEAEEYLSQLHKRGNNTMLPKMSGTAVGTIDIGITIITVSRNRHGLDNYEPKYLTQVLSKFLELLEEGNDLKLTYQLYICNVDDEPKTYHELRYLSKFVQTFQRFPDSNELNLYRSIDQTLEKEKEDYIFCGEEMLKRNVSNIFLVEDDALPHNDLITVLDHIVPQFLTSQKRNNNIAYLKFYHPDRLLGYISLEPERIPELIGLSVILSAVLVSIYLRLRPSMSKRNKLLWLFFFAYSCGLFLIIGRQNLMEARRMSKHLYQVTPAPSCCTPAILFKRNGFTKIANYLKSVRCRGGYGKDTAMDEFRSKSGLIARMVQPNLFTHIGMYSSLRDNILDPFIV